MMTTSTADIAAIARDVLHLDHLRPGQAEAVQALLAGHDTLAIMPTGSGKSAVYQLAAHLLPGLCVVILPLIALQRDQLDSLERLALGPAALLNSTLPHRERAAIFAALADGALTFLLLAPEQCANAEVLAALRDAHPALFVVDEAHCISEWGHDFRPDYLRLGAVIGAVGQPRVLALTATATPPVRAEIVERLGLRRPRTIVQGFDRPNLFFGVETFHTAEDKRHALRDHIRAATPPGIVYVATHNAADEIAAEIDVGDLRAAAYHAGLKGAERTAIQEAFMAGEIDVIVATSAFGMGIDKADVRYVFHEHISEAVDEYYQEVGRGGRDGEPSQAILFYRSEDVGVRRFMAGSGHLTADEVQTVLCARRAGSAPTTQALHTALDGGGGKVDAILGHLAEAGALTITSDGALTWATEQRDEATLVAEVVNEHERLQRAAHSRVEMMQGYAESRACRRAYLLNYFGEDFTPPCGNCDNCLAGLVAAQPAHQPYAIGSPVRHTALGLGSVVRYEGDTITVLFEEAGYQTLDLALVVAGGLLVAG